MKLNITDIALLGRLYGLHGIAQYQGAPSAGLASHTDMIAVAIHNVSQSVIEQSMRRLVKAGYAESESVDLLGDKKCMRTAVRITATGLEKCEETGIDPHCTPMEHIAYVKTLVSVFGRRGALIQISEDFHGKPVRRTHREVVMGTLVWASENDQPMTDTMIAFHSGLKLSAVRVAISALKRVPKRVEVDKRSGIVSLLVAAGTAFYGAVQCANWLASAYALTGNNAVMLSLIRHYQKKIIHERS